MVHGEVDRQLVALDHVLVEGLGAGPAGEDALPRLGDGAAEGRGGTESGDDDATLAHGCCSLLVGADEGRGAASRSREAASGRVSPGWTG